MVDRRFLFDSMHLRKAAPGMFPRNASSCLFCYFLQVFGTSGHEIRGNSPGGCSCILRDIAACQQLVTNRVSAGMDTAIVTMLWLALFLSGRSSRALRESCFPARPEQPEDAAPAHGMNGWRRLASAVVEPAARCISRTGRNRTRGLPRFAAVAGHCSSWLLLAETDSVHQRILWCDTGFC